MLRKNQVWIYQALLTPATHMPTDFQLPVSVFLGAFPKYVRLEIQMNYHPLGTVFHQLQMGVGI